MTITAKPSYRTVTALTAGVACAFLAAGASAMATPADTTTHIASHTPQTFAAYANLDYQAVRWGGRLHFTHAAHIRTGPSTRRTSKGLGMRGDRAQWSYIGGGQFIRCPDRRNIQHTPNSQTWYRIRDLRTGVTGYTSSCFIGGTE